MSGFEKLTPAPWTAKVSLVPDGVTGESDEVGEVFTAGKSFLQVWHPKKEDVAALEFIALARNACEMSEEVGRG